jgi:hypothetical protein
MLSRTLSALTSVRVTLSYGLTLATIAITLLMLGPRVEDVVVRHMSTNLHNLANGRIGTLIGSAFVSADGYTFVWLPGLVCLLALGELLWRSGRLVLAFGLGHVGATLVVAVGLVAAIRFGWVPISVARSSDVGVSYGAAAVLGTLTAAIPARWRPAWIGWWLAVAALAACIGDGFTPVGHFVALTLGMLLSVRFRSTPQWTAWRFVLLALGAGFGYLVLADGVPPVSSPIAGLFGALFAHVVTRRWRRRVGQVTVARPITPQD